MTGRTKQQRGYIFRKGKFWFLRYADTVLRDGRSVRVQLCKKLAPYCDAYRNEKSVRPLAAEILIPINAGTQDVRSTMRVSDFVEGVYLPQVKVLRRPSTLKNYKDIFRIHLKPRLGEISLRQFRCVDGERLLGDIARQAKTKDGKPLGRNTLSRIKSFLSGTFKTAKRVGALDAINPMVDTSLQGGTPPGVTHAYNLPEIRAMLAVLPEPTKTIVLFAAFTGLRQGEIRGVRWQDFTGKTLTVERSIWNAVVNKPKTVCSAAPIPIVRPLADALEVHRLRMGELAAADLPMFQSGIGTPINLANVAKRIIVPRIEKCVRCRKPKAEHRPEAHLFDLDRTLFWKGWHAFRRGLATTLHQLGTPDREIQAILRHSNIAVTQASYIKSVSESQQNALDLVAAEMASGPSCNDSATEVKGPVN
jgi:integrase